MIPREAIEKAIEGGWKRSSLHIIGHETFLGDPTAVNLHLGNDRSKYRTRVPYAEIALDPLFWQALGKSLGWPTGEEPDISLFDWKMKGWSGRAHRFYDLIHTNGDTDVYWKELLKA